MQKILNNTKFVDDYVVFDIETTGLSSINDKIIEISAVKYIKNQKVSVFSCLINPQISLPNIIVKVTGITDKDLKEKPLIHEVLPEFLNFVKDFTLIGHNVSFDISFINQNLKKMNIKELKNNIIDTLFLSRNTIHDAENYKLETLKRYLNLDFNSHRAEDDCYTCNALYQYCKNKQDIKI